MVDSQSLTFLHAVNNYTGYYIQLLTLQNYMYLCLDMPMHHTTIDHNWNSVADV